MSNRFFYHLALYFALDISSFTCIKEIIYLKCYIYNAFGDGLVDKNLDYYVASMSHNKKCTVFSTVQGQLQ